MTLPGLHGLSLKELATRSFREFRRDDMMTYAAALSFHILLALFPFVIFLLTQQGQQEDHKREEGKQDVERQRRGVRHHVIAPEFPERASCKLLEREAMQSRQCHRHNPSFACPCLFDVGAISYRTGSARTIHAGSGLQAALLSTLSQGCCTYPTTTIAVSYTHLRAHETVL